MLLFLFNLSICYADNFELKSSAFKKFEKIPDLYTCNGKSRSPALSWKNAPVNTKSFALIMSSPDATISAMSYLWVVYNIPAEVTTLQIGLGNLLEEAQVGTNSMGHVAYSGPCPHDDHVYHYLFTLYALDTPFIYLPEASSAEVVLKKIKRHIIKQTQLTGVYSH